MGAELVNSDNTGAGGGIGSGCGSSDSLSRELLADVEQRWVKLSPNHAHVAQCLSGIKFTSPGKWNVYVRYRGVKVGFEQKSLLQSAGCKLPETEVMSSPLEVEIFDEPPR
jgi:hypothetical protein